jgi:predicted alpha/beta-hydrolase family hydrolase
MILAVQPLFLFAPGAGAPSSHPWMLGWKERLATIGQVETFDYDYMINKRRYPDPLLKLIARHRAVLLQVRANTPNRIVLIGKSMGGRVGCHVALEEEVAAVVCFGFPLCAGGDRTKLRDQVLRELRRPVLFVQGTRDPLCPLDLLERVRGEMTAHNVLHIVEGGDHSLRVSRRSGSAQDEQDRAILQAVRDFVMRVAA